MKFIPTLTSYKVELLLAFATAAMCFQTGHWKIGIVWTVACYFILLRKA